MSEVTRRFTVEVKFDSQEEADDAGEGIAPCINQIRSHMEQQGWKSEECTSMKVIEQTPLSPLTPLSNFELNPGKYESQSGNFYFSCDTGSSTLVGTRQRHPATGEPYSTCPILGISAIYKYPVNPNTTTIEDYVSYEMPEYAMRLNELATNSLSFPVYKSAKIKASISQITERPFEGSLDEGTGIGFISIEEWNEAMELAGIGASVSDQPASIVKRLVKRTKDEGWGNSSGWICLLFSEVGIYELHTAME